MGFCVRGQTRYCLIMEFRAVEKHIECEPRRHVDIFRALVHVLIFDEWLMLPEWARGIGSVPMNHSEPRKSLINRPRARYKGSVSVLLVS